MRFLLIAVIGGTLVGGACAQAMIEHAASAAGGSIGGVGGKKVSDGISSVFGKVDGQAKAAAKTGKSVKSDKKANASDEPMLQLGAPTVVDRSKGEANKKEIAPKPAHSAKSVNHQAAPAAPHTTPAHPSAPASEPSAHPVPAAAAAIPVVAPPPPAPEIVPSRESLSAVAVGTSRQDVLAKVGTPSSRITMFEDGGAVEILRFSAKSGSLGSVRIVNGSVSEVTLSEN